MSHPRWRRITLQSIRAPREIESEFGPVKGRDAQVIPKTQLSSENIYTTRLHTYRFLSTAASITKPVFFVWLVVVIKSMIAFCKCSVLFKDKQTSFFLIKKLKYRGYKTMPNIWKTRLNALSPIFRSAFREKRIQICDVQSPGIYWRIQPIFPAAVAFNLLLLDIFCALNLGGSIQGRKDVFIDWIQSQI